MTARAGTERAAYDVLTIRDSLPEEEAMPPEDEHTLPDLTEIPGVELDDPMNLLSDEQKKALKSDLDDMARNRRRAEATSGTLRLT